MYVQKVKCVLVRTPMCHMGLLTQLAQFVIDLLRMYVSTLCFSGSNDWCLLVHRDIPSCTHGAPRLDWHTAFLHLSTALEANTDTVASYRKKDLGPRMYSTSVVVIRCVQTGPQQEGHSCRVSTSINSTLHKDRQAARARAEKNMPGVC
jgi:hypothetical protein